MRIPTLPTHYDRHLHGHRVNAFWRRVASRELSLVPGARVRAAGAVTAGLGVVGNWRLAPGKVVRNSCSHDKRLLIASTY